MITSGNVTVYYTNMNNIYMVYWHVMVVPVKFSFWFSSYINSSTSVELTTDKMQTLLKKQEPEGVYNTELYELQIIIIKLRYIWLGQGRYSEGVVKLI